ncbi:rhomboid-domain-containing protein [Gloeophyllum trabeum ATCC 11539]|uniref:Rhomboid-domain-containing protein n=1 Tax=Gloeophyllum trabeum (strain ATCC 11539 / FP-39264 / Madison 617) TaxID=670483 RepID=S7S1D8_GLOTA|nr:rhomboid-domain-containing protein [Gloeophyllum trabeum ATCC 11539]EPQ59549.1 rhomboid-domain-containing protein [Gloeophyllum trabeum ATCC 11539]
MATLTFASARHVLLGTLHCSVTQRTLSVWSNAVLRGVHPNAHLKLGRSNPLRAVPTAVPARLFSTPSKILRFVRTDVWKATHRSGGYGSAPPPRRPTESSIRRAIDSLPSGIFLWGILGLNGAILLLWGYASGIAQQNRDFTWLKWMHENFLVSMRNVREGRWWTLLTCCFSHQEMMHFLVNAFTYGFMAPGVIAILGNASFLTLYLGGGILSSGLSLLWSEQVKKRDTSSQGASGAIYAVISFFACVAPRAELLIFGIVPCPAWIVVGSLFVYDSWRSITDRGGRTDTAGHIGGMFAGAGYFILKRMGMRF